MKLEFKPRYFNPAKTGKAAGKKAAAQEFAIVQIDSQDSYVYNDNIVLAINLALSTGRPLFISGNPGAGKTTLARNVAHVLGWRYYQAVVTSRTRARDLMWTFDVLRRLSDAQSQNTSLPPRAAYVQPQALWWAFDPASAVARGASDQERIFVKAASDPATGNLSSKKAVVLLDEIDKAEPDVPNDLLEALDVDRFTVEDLDVPRVIEADTSTILLMITSNGERELPPAFLRRCVVLHLDDPTEDGLVTIADDRFGKDNNAFHREFAQQVIALRNAASGKNERGPSTAEYLDAVRACKDLGINSQSDAWALVTSALLLKREKAQ